MTETCDCLATRVFYLVFYRKGFASFWLSCLVNHVRFMLNFTYEKAASTWDVPLQEDCSAGDSLLDCASENCHSVPGRVQVALRSLLCDLLLAVLVLLLPGSPFQWFLEYVLITSEVSDEEPAFLCPSRVCLLKDTPFLLPGYHPDFLRLWLHPRGACCVGGSVWLQVGDGVCYCAMCLW